MTFRKRIQYFLVKKLQISNKEALSLILEGEVKINDIVVYGNIEITIFDTISYNKNILQIGKKPLYYAYYKPKGVETTMNDNIVDNLKSILKIKDVFPIGRLDKASEGLIILTNDGSIYDKILRKEFEIEKEYLVEVDKIVNDNFIQKMSSGIVIMGKKTLACYVEKINDYCFKIILIQGLNRQIRRMTYQLGYEVLSLKRIRIATVLIGNLKPNEYKAIFDLRITNIY